MNTSYKDFRINRELSQNFVELVPSGTMIVDSHGKIIAANSELNSILSSKENSINNKNINDFLPDDVQNRHQSLLKFFFDNPAPRQMGSGRQLFARTLSGKEIPIEIGLNPILIDDELCVLATLVDITYRLEANALFEKSIQMAPHGILMVDGSGEIKLANDSLCSCFGYASDQIVGHPIEVLLPERYREKHKALRKEFWNSPSLRMMGKGRDLTALHSDGREFPVEIGLSPLNDDKNTILVTLTDITARKKLELELKESNTNLEEFTYVASHDLRSPLRGISDLLDWVKEDLGDNVSEDVTHNLQRIAVRIDKMETLIENLLAYARAGKINSDVEVIDINDLVENVLGLVDMPTNFKVIIDLNAEEINAARTPIETVLRNLVSNAVKHHDKEDGFIKICTDFEGNMIRFTVEDNGPGIPEKAMTRIFRLFQTATSSERNSGGIGLSVSRRLTETHGGKIDVKNTGSGSAFSFWWPRFIRKDTHE